MCAHTHPHTKSIPLSLSLSVTHTHTQSILSLSLSLSFSLSPSPTEKQEKLLYFSPTGTPRSQAIKHSSKSPPLLSLVGLPSSFPWLLHQKKLQQEHTLPRHIYYYYMIKSTHPFLPSPHPPTHNHTPPTREETGPKPKPNEKKKKKNPKSKPPTNSLNSLSQLTHSPK